jgi:hypothetical protein
MKSADEKKPAKKRAFLQEAEPELLQFHFLVVHVLASLGIKFLDQHLLGHEFFVLAGRVEMTSTGCGFQLDFFASAFGCHGATP